MAGRESDKFATVRRVLHLVSDPVAAGRIDRWLMSSAVITERFESAYVLCAALAAGTVAEPDLVLLGVELLSDDELPIAEFIRRRWPAVAIVCYGQRPLTGVTGGAFRHVASADAVQRMLHGSPDELLRSLRASPSPVRVVEVSSLAAGKPAARPPRQEAAPAAGRAEAGSDRPPAAAESAPINSRLPLRSLLSPEELAALLEGPRQDD